MKKLVLLLLLIIFVKASVVDYHPIPSESMVPTLQVDDIVIVNRLQYGLRVPFTEHYLVRWAEPAVGDIVVFADPISGGINSWIKRVAAVEGDTIEFKQETLFLNSNPLKCEKTYEEEAFYDCVENLGVEHTVRWFTLLSSGDTMPAYEIPEKSVFLVGDNRNNSHDSRFFGTVDVDTIYGKMAFKVSNGAPYTKGLLFFLVLWIAVDILKALKRKGKAS